VCSRWVYSRFGSTEAGWRPSTCLSSGKSAQQRPGSRLQNVYIIEHIQQISTVTKTEQNRSCGRRNKKMHETSCYDVNPTLTRAGSGVLVHVVIGGHRDQISAFSFATLRRCQKNWWASLYYWFNSFHEVTATWRSLGVSTSLSRASDQVRRSLVERS
jgi:hypothetical protein